MPARSMQPITAAAMAAPDAPPPPLPPLPAASIAPPAPPAAAPAALADRVALGDRLGVTAAVGKGGRRSSHVSENAPATYLFGYAEMATYTMRVVMPGISTCEKPAAAQ